MFTGIVQQLGAVRSMEPVDFGAVLVVDPRGWAYAPAPGDSVAVNGCCLTVTEGPPGGLRFDVIRQTLGATNLGDLEPGMPVNLEHAVTPSTLLGGHIVQGHIDGVGTVRRVDRDDQEWRVTIEPPAGLMAYVMEKGSVALDGVSLTVAAAAERTFEVALIPTTLRLTTFGERREGERVNVETDYVAKTVVSWLERVGGGGVPGAPTAGR